MTASAKRPLQGVVNELRHVVGKLPRRSLVTIAGVVTFAVVGTVLLVGSHAATPTASFEPEAGTRSGNASIVSDSGASGSSAVKFSATSGGTSTCPYRFPTPSCVGLPAGWTSTATYTSDRIISADNAVVENITMDGAVLYITGDNVTVRKVKFTHGAGISTERNNYCAANTVIEDSTFTPDGVDWLAPGIDATIQTGGYTARRIYMDGVYEALRVGGRGLSGSPCGSTTIEKSYIRASYPVQCPSTPGWDWHGDGLQFYDGQYSTITDTVINLDELYPNCAGTAPLFLADQCNTGSPNWNTVSCTTIQPWFNNTLAAHGGVISNINGLMLAGGGYSFRAYMPVKVSGLYIKNDSWHFRAADVDCSNVTAGWDAHVATIDGNGQPVSGAAVACL
ncbi:hypothetical protein EYC59_03010 [Candidatus Saccharibacteria bacterium]|nr:MAG: hypothetical protein EYC59_03010 [Candidatus Saccharibacteria bacterium]